MKLFMWIWIWHRGSNMSNSIKRKSGPSDRCKNDRSLTPADGSETAVQKPKKALELKGT